MKLSIVATLYHSSPYLKEFHQRITQAAAQITDDYEIVFVNDGSPDNSSELVSEIMEKDSHVVLAELSRNFGHHPAMMTGIEIAKGDHVFLIDCDLEEPPELLNQFWETMHQATDQPDMVFGVQKKRAGSWLKRVCGHFFYAVLGFVSDHPIVKNPLTVRLMNRDFVDALCQYKERELVLTGMDSLVGFKREPVLIDKPHKGKSQYTLTRQFALAARYISSLSSKPLVYIFYLGTCISSISFIYFIYLIIRRIFWNVSVSGWTSLMVSIWFIGGLLIFCIGIVGIYLSIIFNEVKARPRTIIRHIKDHQEK